MGALVTAAVPTTREAASGGVDAPAPQAQQASTSTVGSNSRPRTRRFGAEHTRTRCQESGARAAPFSTGTTAAGRNRPPARRGYAGDVDSPTPDGTRRPDQPLHVRRWDLGTARVRYERAWVEQRRVHTERVDGSGADTVLLLEHDPVYTAGKRTEPHERPLDGSPVLDVDRGGKITFHGPGQLVGYPVLRLPAAVYVVDHVRRMEEALIRACADLGVSTGRVPGRSGVWLAADPVTGRAERKVAALGVRVSRGVTMHGFALNCDVDLTWYDRIVPCGIADAGVTSLSAELGRDVGVLEAAGALEPHLHALFAWGRYDRSPDVPRSTEPVSPVLTVGAVPRVAYHLTVVAVAAP